jgi:nitrogen fixation protein NifU and related proteins
MPDYSATARDHFQNPRNVGALRDATSIGRAMDGDNQVWIYLRVAAEQIRAAQFRALACNSCIACASMTTVLVAGLSTAEARGVTAERLVEALDGLPPDKRHCAALAAEALRNALGSAD